MISKRTLLLISSTFSILFIVFMYIGNPKLCKEMAGCIKILSNIEIYTLLVVPIFIFSSITYFMSDDTFRSWLKFTYFWILFSIILIYLSPVNNPGLFIQVFDSSFVSIILSGFFILISLIIILIKHFSLKKPVI